MVTKLLQFLRGAIRGGSKVRCVLTLDLYESMNLQHVIQSIREPVRDGWRMGHYTSQVDGVCRVHFYRSTYLFEAYANGWEVSE